MEKVRRINFHAEDWLVGTTSLDLAERGLYITACALIYAHGGPVALSDLRAACRGHGNAFNRALRRLIDLGKLTEKGKEIGQKRCENELEIARKRIVNGKENVSKRWENNGLAAGALLLRANANHQPSTIKESPVPSTESLEPESESYNTPQPTVAASGGYAFSGKLVRLKHADLAAWKSAYHAIPDIIAELHTLDTYYDDTLSGAERKRWFVRCSSALDKKHQAQLAERSAKGTGPGKAWTIGVG